MSEVMLSASMNSNLLALNNTQKMFDDVQGKLATGKEVNSAMDDPSAFYTAQSLTQRANDLNSLMDSMGQAVQTLKAADQGMTALSSFNDQAKSLANQARDDADKVVKTDTAEIGTGLTETTELNEHATDDLVYTIAITDEDSNAVSSSTVTIAADETVGDFITKVNAEDNGLKASLEGGKLKLESTSAGGNTVAITSAGGTEAATVGITGEDVKNDPSDSAKEYAAQFNEIIGQMNELANDSGYKGINLLQSDDLLVVFNEDRTSTLNISGADMSATGLGLSEVSNEDFSDSKDIDAVIVKIDAATEKLRSQSAAFGNNLSIVETRSDFTENLINTLEEGANSLVEADTTELSAQMLQLQTNQSLGMNALSLASQSSQAVLQLF